jgi:cytidylate kinase
VAEQLGWQLINRAIPVEVAEQLSIPIDVALANDEGVGGKFWRAIVRSTMQMAVDVGSNLPREVLTGEEAFRTATQAIINRVAASSDCVIVGRAAAVILQGRADALHVRLDGPANARVQQAMAALNIVEGEARRKLQQTDRARAEYLRLFYHKDWADPSLYHLVIDSTAIPLSVCAHIVIAAAKTRILEDRFTGSHDISDSESESKGSGT